MSEQQSGSRFQRPGLILAMICLPVFIGALDLTIVSAVLPNVIADLQLPFQTGADDAAWVVSGYLLAYTVSVAMMGRISDIIGRRRTYFVSLIIFILGSWLVATATYTPTSWMTRIVRIIQGGGRPDTSYMALYALIAGRVIQAFGAGAMVPVSMALVGDLYPPQQRATALGIVGAIDTAGWVLGHLYGGIMVQFVAWPVLFWINIPITAAIAYITWRQLSSIAESHDEGSISRIGHIIIGIGIGTVSFNSFVEIIRAVAIYISTMGEEISTIPPSIVRFDEWAQTLIETRWIALAIGILLLASIVMTLIESKRIKGASRPNWPATVLLTIILITLNIGLGGGGEPGLTTTLEETEPVFTPFAVVMLIVTLVGLIAYVLMEQRSKYPLFHLSNFKDRNVSLTAVINLFVGFCLMVGLVSVPLFVTGVIATDLDQAALLSGILLGALTIPMALASIPGGLLTERVGYRIPTVAGMILAVIGFALGRTWTPDITQLTMGLHMALAGIGLGLTVAPVGTAMINAVDAQERGSASALVLIMRLIGMTLGISIMTHYGLRRSAILLEEAINTIEGNPEFAQLVQIGLDITTQVINEMLLTAALIAALAIIPAFFLRRGDRTTEHTVE